MAKNTSQRCNHYKHEVLLSEFKESMSYEEIIETTVCFTNRIQFCLQYYKFLDFMKVCLSEIAALK